MHQQWGKGGAYNGRINKGSMKKIFFTIIFACVCTIVNAQYVDPTTGKTIRGYLGPPKLPFDNKPPVSKPAAEKPAPHYKYKFNLPKESNNNSSVSTEEPSVPLTELSNKPFVQVDKYGNLSENFFSLYKKKDWRKVSCGYDYSMAIDDNGALYGWGNNNNGQLGTGNKEPKSDPVLIDAKSGWNMLSCAGGVLGIKSDSTLWEWGTYKKLKPTLISKDHWLFIAQYMSSSFAIKSDGTLWAWGLNSDGALGLPNDYYSLPTQVGKDNDWIKIFPVYQSTFGIKKNGVLWGWGKIKVRNIGIMAPDVKLTEPTMLEWPIYIEDTWDKIVSDGSNSSGIKKDGTLWWASNSLMKKVDSTMKWKDIAIVTNNCFAIRNDGTLWKIGYLEYGQVGKDNDWKSITAANGNIKLLKENGSMWDILK